MSGKVAGLPTYMCIGARLNLERCLISKYVDQSRRCMGTHHHLMDSPRGSKGVFAFSYLEHPEMASLSEGKSELLC